MDVLRRATARLAEAGCSTSRLDAELLLMEALGWSREDLYRSPETVLDARETERFVALVGRRAGGEPVAYLRGTQEFWSLEFAVTRDVLIPRPETEHLVEAVVDSLSERHGWQRVLDLGTGSGAIALSVARECPEAEVWATDVSAPALAVARKNARRHGVGRRIHLFQGDLCAPVRDLPGYFDAVVSNPPYISTREMARLPRDVREWEPTLALDGGVDGMGFYRRIVEEAIPLLREGGLLAVEVGADLGDAVCELFRAHRDIRGVRMQRDYAGLPRVVAAERIRVTGRAGN
ncbi:MAG: peptide chain release factor N(5)-glutamine methyltransferase [Deltaproteobacteria bacterium]|nr:peptide chain release factor N(5)-glutamine methyltransferase [Deltaproteobacteria bacterium]